MTSEVNKRSHHNGNNVLDEEDDEENEDGGVWFYVNRGGFPINKFTWDRMYKHVEKLHPSSQNIRPNIQNCQDLPDIAIPQAPVTFPPNTLVQDRLEIIQNYMSDLQYNHTGTQFFEIKKNRPISGLMDSAKEMIKESLPIKCLEAVIVGLYLTLGTPALDRFPISFKTTFNGNTYRHVVLGVYSLGKYGALGMSRRSDLMYKPLVFKSLSELALDFKTSYEKYWHTVKKIKIGVPVPHDPHSFEHINWKQLSLSPMKMSNEEMCKDLDRYAREMRTQSKKREAVTSVYVPQKARPPTTATSPPHPSKTSASMTTKSATDRKQANRKSKSEKTTVRQSSSEGKKAKPTSIQGTQEPHSHTDVQPTTADTTPSTLNTAGYQLRI